MGKEIKSISDVSKEDLIKTIAIIHDVIQNWDQEYGLSEEEVNKLTKIGKLCYDYCITKINNWVINV